MLSVTQIAVASMLITFAIATPTLHKRSAFTIHQTANHGHVKNGPASYAKTVAKFGAAPEKMSAALMDRESVTATPIQHDSEYVCPVTIGNQIFSLNFDTASADLWVFGAQSGISGHPIYIPGSTAKRLRGARWSISYEDDSSASGIVYNDAVDVGGVKIIRQAVQMATLVSSAAGSDGILGLAFSKLNRIRPTRQRAWFHSAVAQGLPAIFAADLGAGAPGYYDFGELSSFYSDSHITYINVDNSKGFWEVIPDSITIGTNIRSDLSYEIGAGVVDTGGSLLLLDQAIVLAYYSEVSGATYDLGLKAWVFDCSINLPDFTITFNGYNAVVPGSYINYAPVDTLGRFCYGGIQSDVDIGNSIYGDVFLKSQYVVFDLTTGSPRLGFTAKVKRD